MVDEPLIEVEVVWATPERQDLVSLKLPAGASAADAIQAAGFGQLLEEIDAGRLGIGIFSRMIVPEQVLEGGDRVEIYRPLQIDPREARRRLAAAGKSLTGRQEEAAPEGSGPGSPRSVRATRSPSK